MGPTGSPPYTQELVTVSLFLVPRRMVPVHTFTPVYLYPINYTSSSNWSPRLKFSDWNIALLPRVSHVHCLPRHPITLMIIVEGRNYGVPLKIFFLPCCYCYFLSLRSRYSSSSSCSDNIRDLVSLPRKTIGKCGFPCYSVFISTQQTEEW
jgi:hypothetical protein